jgi:hypothetical protein
VQLEEFGKLKKSNYLIRNRTHDLLACSIVPQPTIPTTLPGQTWNLNTHYPVKMCIFTKKFSENLDKKEEAKFPCHSFMITLLK